MVKNWIVDRYTARDFTVCTKIEEHFEFWILIDFPAKIISSTCCRLEADRKIAEHQIHELQARLDEVEANALKNGKKAAAKLEARFELCIIFPPKIFSSICCRILLWSL